MTERNGKIRLAFLTAALLSISLVPAARAGWSVGVSLGAPFCGRPCYGPPPCYYRPYPIYVRPAAYYVQPVTVIEQVPVYTAAPATLPVPIASTPAPVIARAHSTSIGTDDDIQRYQQQLQNPEPRERAEAVVQLGRLRAPGSLASLTATLSNDRSPLVREAAARSLGLFGASDALDALQRAAQNDEDPQVRHSASYAADVIRANLTKR